MIKRINYISAYAITIWVCTPIVGQRTGLITGALISIIWLLSSIVIGYKETVANDLLYMFLFFLYIIIASLIFGRVYSTYNFLEFIPMLLLFYLPFYITLFYLGHDKIDTIKRLGLLSIVCIIIGEIMSIKYSIEYPGIIKSIDSIENLNTQMLLKVGIGGFGFVYLVMFATIASYQVIDKLNFYTKYLLYAFLVLSVVFILFSTFATALILCSFGILLSGYYKKEASNTYMLKIILIIIGLYFLYMFLPLILESLGIEGEGVLNRLTEIDKYISGGETGDNVDSRSNLFSKSVRSLFYNIPFGCIMSSSTDHLPGGHCEWTDMIASYGVMAYFAYMTLFVKIRYLKADLLSNADYNYSPILITLIIYGFVDPVIRIYHIGYVLFLFIPAIAYLPNDSTDQ